ncbi:glycosyltransferase family 9 protein [Duganella fentianensis]|uniref:glycosyltransferase family 9 protein n=1 Tax=Duganella fentianensis TaxID=2692177 RepID=UPI0032B28352
MAFFRKLQPLPATAMAPGRRIMLAKTTQLGDLVISLPMAAALKRHDPHCTVILLTNRRTADIARHCPDVDEVFAAPEDAAELTALLAAVRPDIFIQVNPCRRLAQCAYDAALPIRIGSLFRRYNWQRCTHLVPISSPNSGLNKRLLDLQYLRPLGIVIKDASEIPALYHLAPPASTGATPAEQQLPATVQHPAHYAQGRRTVILSPALVTARSHQWPLEFYAELIARIDPREVHWFICGTAEDRASLQPLLQRHAHAANVTDMVGRLSLTEFMAFISQCDGLVAGSTGPLHLAAALGIHTLGLFQSRRSDVQRWRPLGPMASVIHSQVRCRGERRLEQSGSVVPCPCMQAIAPATVAEHVRSWFGMRGQPN